MFNKKEKVKKREMEKKERWGARRNVGTGDKQLTPKKT